MTLDAPQTLRGFPVTNWTLLRLAREGDERVVAEVLETLCRAYWRPLYAYARGRGLERADAQDAVQDFFAMALRRELFARADAMQGKLRSFLLTAMKHHLQDRAAQERAARRKPAGGWAEVEFEVAEAEWARTKAGGAGPEAGFERQWARELLAQAEARVEARYAKDGKERLFAELKAEALAEKDQVGNGKVNTTDEAAADPVRMTAGARRVAVHRMRKRFAEDLRAVVAETLPEGGDTEAELRELAAALRGGRA